METPIAELTPTPNLDELWSKVEKTPDLSDAEFGALIEGEREKYLEHERKEEEKNA